MKKQKGEKILNLQPHKHHKDAGSKWFNKQKALKTREVFEMPYNISITKTMSTLEVVQKEMKDLKW